MKSIAPAGNCETCRRGLATPCPHRTVLGILNHDGAFADYIAVPECNLHRVPDEISTEAAVFTEPLAAAFQIPAQIPLSKEMRVVVLGDGRLGNCVRRSSASQGATVSVVGKHRRKLALLEELGIATQLLENLSPDRRADVVVGDSGISQRIANGVPDYQTTWHDRAQNHRGRNAGNDIGPAGD